MNRIFLEKNLQFLTFQRNMFATITLLLSMALIILASFLFLKNERIIITPTLIEKEFWVDSHSISPTYLEQFGSFLGQLILNKSAHSSQVQRAILLRHTDPSYTGALKQKLIEEEEMLKKQNASYVFYPIEVKVDNQSLEVILIGDRLTYVLGKQISSEKEGYVLHFVYTGTKLFLKGISSYDLSKQGI